MSVAIIGRHHHAIVNKYGQPTVQRIQLYNSRKMMTVLILCLKRKGIPGLPQELFLHIASFIPIYTRYEYEAAFPNFLDFGFVMPEMIVFCPFQCTLSRMLQPNRLNKSNELVYTTLPLARPVHFIAGKKDYRKYKHDSIQPIQASHPRFALYGKFIKTRHMGVLNQWIDIESKNIHSLYELLEEQSEQACIARTTEEIHQLHKRQMDEFTDFCKMKTLQMQRSVELSQTIQQAITRQEEKRDDKVEEVNRLGALWQV